MKTLKSIVAWCKAKFGRLVTGTGALLQLSDLDISPIKSSLEAILSHAWVEGIVVALFLLSHLRHRWVASQHPAPVIVPPAAPESIR